jgi:hypothetical protein
MKSTDASPLEPEDMLENSILAVRNTCVEDAMVDRCRRRALAIAHDELPERASAERVSSENGRLTWFFPLAVAASVAIVVNVPQIYASLPATSRQRAAVHIDSDGRRMIVFSDLRFEPGSSWASE